MRMKQGLRIVLGGVLLAVAAYAILAAPGLLTDTASTVPEHGRHHQLATVQP